MTGPRFDAAAHARAMREEGFWVDKTYDEFLQKAIASTPDKLAHCRRSRRPFRAAAFHLRRVGRSRFARRRGAREGPGHRTRRRHLRAIAELVGICGRRARLGPRWRGRQSADADLSRARTELHARFRRDKGFHRPEAFSWLRPRGDGALRFSPSLPKLQHVIVVDGEGANSFDRGAAVRRGAATRLRRSARSARCPPIEMAVLMFTSGTTGSPKGVMHCLNTLMACNIALAGRFGLDATDAMLVCSPLGHMTGFAAGMLLGLKIGATVIFQDIWEPKRGVCIMAAEGVTYSAGAAPFLADMCEAVAAGAPKPAKLRKFLCAGAPIPPALIERVYRELDLQGLFALGHDRIAFEHADGAGARAREVVQDRRAAARGRRRQGASGRTVARAAIGETGLLMVRGAQMASATTSARTWSRSTPRVGSTPATSPIWTTRATSASTAASRTSSFAAARTCRSSRSRTCCSSIRQCSRQRWSDIRIRAWENAPAPSSCCVRDTRSI